MNLAMRMQSKTKQEEMLSLQSPGSISSSFSLAFKDFLHGYPAQDCGFQQCCWGPLFVAELWEEGNVPSGAWQGATLAGVPPRRNAGASRAMLRGTSWVWSPQQETRRP